MTIFPRRDAALMTRTAAFAAAAAFLLAVFFQTAVPDSRLFRITVCGLVMAIGLSGVGMFLGYHGRIFGLRYGASDHDDLTDVIPGMVSQTFAGLTVLAAPVVMAIIATH